MAHLILASAGNFNYRNSCLSEEGLKQIGQLAAAIKYSINHSPVHIISSTAFPSINSAKQLALELNLLQEVEINQYFNDFFNGHNHEEWPGSYHRSNSIIHTKLEQAENLIIVSDGRTLGTLFHYARFTYYNDPSILFGQHPGIAMDMDLEQRTCQLMPNKQMKKAMEREQRSSLHRTEQEDSNL